METLTLLDLMVLAVSAVLILSKFLDCYTTHKYIRHSIETNPIGSFLMEIWDRKLAIWAIFIFVLLIITASAAYYFIYPNLFYGISFVLLGTIISVFQFAVAHFNYQYGRGKRVTNPLIQMTMRFHGSLNKLKVK